MVNSVPCARARTAVEPIKFWHEKMPRIFHPGHYGLLRRASDNDFYQPCLGGPVGPRKTLCYQSCSVNVPRIDGEQFAAAVESELLH